MRSALKDIKKLKDQFILDNISYELKVSSSELETERLKQCASMDDVLIILELKDAN